MELERRRRLLEVPERLRLLMPFDNVRLLRRPSENDCLRISDVPSAGKGTTTSKILLLLLRWTRFFSFDDVLVDGRGDR
jgi:hypothetical protein